MIIMQYAEVSTPKRIALVTLEPTSFGKPYQDLFDQTDLSGAEVFAAYSHNNFLNPFQQADEQRYKQMGWWAEIFRDIVRNGGKGTTGGRLNISYVSHAGTEWEKTHDLWAPKNGWYVPTNDGLFVPETLIPFETVDTKADAMKRLEAKGLPNEQASYFYRLDNYDGDRFVGRVFYPGVGGGGRFGVDADWLPSGSGVGGVGSRPAYGKAEAEIVMKASSVEPVKVE